MKHISFSAFSYSGHCLKYGLVALSLQFNLRVFRWLLLGLPWLLLFEMTLFLVPML